MNLSLRTPPEYFCSRAGCDAASESDFGHHIHGLFRSRPLPHKQIHSKSNRCVPTRRGRAEARRLANNDSGNIKSALFAEYRILSGGESTPTSPKFIPFLWFWSCLDRFKILTDSSNPVVQHTHRDKSVETQADACPHRSAHLTDQPKVCD